MYRLPLMIWIVLSWTGLRGQSPHGRDLNIDCSQCHTPDNWKVSSKSMAFSHETTSFRLRGQHEQTDCRACHATLVFSDASPECISCHQDMHSQSLGNDCARCHNTSSWVIENVTRMHERVSFPLLGNHAVADCNDCHQSSVPLRFDRIGTACIQCHENDFLGTEKVDHKKAGFSRDCAPCHDIRAVSWASSFTHDFFPLKKGHEIESCVKCHTVGYAGTSTKCVDCHLTDFNSAVSPNHKATGFSTDCESCHSTEPGWKPATFANHSKFFVITGAHTAITNDCAACHNGVYNGSTPKTCFGCHSDDYNRAKNPNHQASMFSTSCETCHSQAAWTPSTFNHDGQYFRIYSGKHKGEWSQCAECHTTAGNFSNFSCTSCHEHNNKANVDKEHRGVSGYSYTPTSCYSCHRNE